MSSAGSSGRSSSRPTCSGRSSTRCITPMCAAPFRRAPSAPAKARAMALSALSRPRLPRGVKLRRDEVRGRWTLLAPERIFEVDATAATVLELCDGERDLASIVAELARRYNAPEAVIEKDVVAMLGDLEARRVLEA